MLREQGGPHAGEGRLPCPSACSAGRAGARDSTLSVGPESAAIDTPHLASSDRRVHRLSASPGGCDAWNLIGCCRGWAKR